MPSSSVLLSLAAVVVWGAADFTGGYGARRISAYLVALLAHASATIWAAGFALAARAPFPPVAGVSWSLAAGLFGGAALALFYRALAAGKMGLTAPVSAVLGAAIPTAVTIVRQGAPSPLRTGGFILAATGIWLISRMQNNDRPQGIGLAVLAGIGFAGFFLCAKQAGDASPFWIAALAKSASFALTLPVLLATGFPRGLDRSSAGLAALAGCLDVSGSLLFIRASQTGRLDTAVVLSSLYPVVTVILARIVLKEQLTRWRALGMVAALLAVPMIAI